MADVFCTYARRESEVAAEMGAEGIGKFQVLGTLGSGAHSTILHIRRNADARHYALKVVPIEGKEDLKFFEQARHEFEIAQKLSHPNLIRIYQIETQKDWLRRVRKVMLLIEYVNGATIDTIRGLHVVHLVQIFERIADALVHMHRRRIYHADVKPNNILLSRSGEVKLVDFGLAWEEGKPKHRVQGTLEYMAPEQAQRQMVNAATDIYNFGATMYRMLTWQHPPKCVTSIDGMPMDAKTFHSLLKPVQAYNKQVPEPLAELVHRCLKFRAKDRPQRMSEVQGILDHLVDDLVTDPMDRLENFCWE